MQRADELEQFKPPLGVGKALKSDEDLDDDCHSLFYPPPNKVDKGQHSCRRSGERDDAATRTQDDGESDGETHLTRTPTRPGARGCRLQVDCASMRGSGGEGGMANATIDVLAEMAMDGDKELQRILYSSWMCDFEAQGHTTGSAGHEARERIYTTEHAQ